MRRWLPRSVVAIMPCHACCQMLPQSGHAHAPPAMLLLICCSRTPLMLSSLPCFLPRSSVPTGLPAATTIGRSVTIGQGCLLRSCTVRCACVALQWLRGGTEQQLLAGAWKPSAPQAVWTARAMCFAFLHSTSPMAHLMLQVEDESVIGDKSVLLEGSWVEKNAGERFKEQQRWLGPLRQGAQAGP